jgi:flagellar hook assembly protein FlgD
MLRKKFLLGCVVGLICCFQVMAQTGAGSIQGTITDSSGAVVSEAKITAVNTATNATRSTTSSASGAYAIANLPIGSYNVSVEKNGFATSQTNIRVTVSEVMPVNDGTSFIFRSTAKD